MDEYGIYTAANASYFAGVVVQLESLRLHGYTGKLVVFDTGLEPWMREYLIEHGAHVFLMDFVRHIRFTDVKAEEHAGIKDWSFKAFGISQARMFRRFTFIDADYIPLCNLQSELFDRIDRGEFLCTDDGENNWDERHFEAIGVAPGRYVNVNAGFFSLSLDHFDWLIEEWRNLMTRWKPFDLWHGDQGALNAILDKYGVRKSFVGHGADWNQTYYCEKLAKNGMVEIESFAPPILRHRGGNRIYGWHGCGRFRYWHALGVAHGHQYEDEILLRQRLSWLQVPAAVHNLFAHLLLRTGDLAIQDHQLVPLNIGQRGTLDDRAPSADAPHFSPALAAALDIEFLGLRDAVIALALLAEGEEIPASLWRSYFRNARITQVCDESSSGRESGDGAAGHVNSREKYDLIVDQCKGHATDPTRAWRIMEHRLRSGGWYALFTSAGAETLDRIHGAAPFARVHRIDRIENKADHIVVCRKAW